MSRWDTKADLYASNAYTREELAKSTGHLRELLVILDKKQLTAAEWSAMSRIMKAQHVTLDDLRKNR